jgi:hypothetical protein
MIGGCSFVAVQSPSKDDRGRLEAGNCTTSFVAPALDGIFTVVPIAGAALLSSQTETGFGATNNHDGTIIAGATLAVLFGVSALYGVVTVSNCRVARGLVPASGPNVRQQDANRRAEEAAEEAAVRARVKAQAAAAAIDAGANPDAGAPSVAPNQKSDDATP